MARKRFNKADKLTAGGVGIGVVTTYAAQVVATKYAVPLEVSAVVIGAVFGWFSRVAAKIIPDA